MGLREISIASHEGADFALPPASDGPGAGRRGWGQGLGPGRHSAA
jgi:hypothetical protein